MIKILFNKIKNSNIMKNKTKKVIRIIIYKKNKLKIF